MNARWGLAIALLASTGAGAQGVTTNISGAVYDSVGRRHLTDAVVQMVRSDRLSESRTVRTGREGAFRFDSVGTGTWLLAFFSPALDSLDLDSPLVRVTVVDATPVRVMLATPSPRTIVRGACGDSTATPTLWYGRVRDARTGIPLDSVTIVAQWSTIIASGSTISRQTPSLSTTSTREGAFGFCDLPLDEAVLTMAHRGADSTGTTMLGFPAHGLLRRDLFIGRSRAVARFVVDSASGDTVADPVRVGDGQVRGRIVRRDGQPIRGARVVVSESGRESQSNGDGYYAVDSLPLGTRLLEVRALGFVPVMRPIDILATVAAEADVTMDSRQVFLDTVKVVTQRVYDSPQYQEFLRRKRIGFGHFQDEDDLERLNPLHVSDAIRRFPGVYVMGTGISGQVLFRAPSIGRGYCSPAVYIDGMLTANIEGFSLDMLVNAMDVRGIEVYTRTAGMPAQYQTMNGCGSIVIWTGGRRRKLPP